MNVEKTHWQYEDLDNLTLWPENPRKHDIPHLQQVLRDTGMNQPIETWKGAFEGGECDGVVARYVIAGNGRTKTLRMMKLSSQPAPEHIIEKDGKWFVPINRHDDWSFRKASGYVFQENNAFRGKWNRIELKSITKRRKLDLTALGFSDDVRRKMNARENARLSSHASDVPDQFFPSRNVFGVPDLSIKRQADALDEPFKRWGSISRKTEHRGSWHFYTDDYKFSALLKSPGAVPATGCPTAVEPNFSFSEDTPPALALYWIYQKRWLARYWQDEGIRILVDLHVPKRYSSSDEDNGGVHNFLGVPKGWTAYCTRAVAGWEKALDYEFSLAVNHAGTENLLFVVYGGGTDIADYCRMKGWSHRRHDALETRGG